MDPFYLGNPAERSITVKVLLNTEPCFYRGEYVPSAATSIRFLCFRHLSNFVKSENLQLLLSGQGVQAVRPFQEVPRETGSHQYEINVNFTGD